MAASSASKIKAAVHQTPAVKGSNGRGGSRARPASGDAPAQRQLVGVRVLVVDDEEDARDLLEAILSHHGATVRAAESASAGRAALQEFRPHVIISDIGMPGEDGYRFVRSIREQEREGATSTPAIALTAYARAEDRQAAFDAGFDIHLPKPVDINELLDLVERLAHPSPPSR
jgi:CheY-like chemotaxis protein